MSAEDWQTYADDPHGEITHRLKLTEVVDPHPLMQLSHLLPSLFFILPWLRFQVGSVLWSSQNSIFAFESLF